MKSTIIVNELQSLDFGKVLLLLLITSLLCQEITSKIPNDSDDDTSDANDSYLHTNIGSK